MPAQADLDWVASVFSTLAVRVKAAPPLVMALLVAVVLKLFYAGLAAVLAPTLVIDPKMVAANAYTAHLMPQSGAAVYRLLGVWERFDTLWYVRIAGEGYDNPAGIVFFPLYPLLIRVVGGGLPAALLVSFLATVLLFWALQRLVELDYGRDVARRTLAVAAVWPASFILFAGYADSLVMALILAAIFYARTNRAALALPVALLAGLAKSVGVFAAVPLAIYAWRARSWRIGLAAAAPLAGYGLYAAYLWQAGFPSLSTVYAAHWRTQVAAPWDTLAASVAALGTLNPLLIFNLAMLAVVVALLAAKRTPAAYWCFGLAVIGLSLTKRTDPLIQSTARYLIVVFPAFVNLARMGSPLWALAAPAAVNLLLMVGFLKWWLVV